jgi:hypothetical protein
VLRREFAGEERDFALCYPRNWPVVATGSFETDRFGNLATLVELGRRNLLGDGHVRHVLAHALAGADNPVGLLNAYRLVEEEMRDKPLAPFIGLAANVIEDALVGPQDG